MGYDDSPHRPRGEDAQPRSVWLGDGHRGGVREEKGGEDIQKERSEERIEEQYGGRERGGGR